MHRVWRGLLVSLLSTALLACPAAAEVGFRSETEAPPAQGPRPIEDACPEKQFPRGTFRDVAQDSPYAMAIDCVTAWEVAKGTSPTTFSPTATVTRAQMASFITRVILRTGGELDDTPGDYFTDDSGSAHEGDINRLAASDIVKGTGRGEFSPDRLLNRGEMAILLVRAYAHRSGYPEPQTLRYKREDYFVDELPLLYARSALVAAETGMVGGYADGTYRALENLRRDHMTITLSRLLALLVQERLVQPFGALWDADAHPDYDCSYFIDQSAAQAHFVYEGGPAVDVHGLDPDGDGLACHAEPGAIQEHYESLGGSAGVLGAPIRREQDATDAAGRTAEYENGSIYWASDVGAYALVGHMRDAYEASNDTYVDGLTRGGGGPSGGLGFPVRDDYAVDGGRRADFERGYIIWTPDRGPIVITHYLGPVPGAGTAARINTEQNWYQETTVNYGTGIGYVNYYDDNDRFFITVFPGSGKAVEVTIDEFETTLEKILALEYETVGYSYFRDPTKTSRFSLLLATPCEISEDLDAC